MKKWYDASGNDGDIVISSRIRLAVSYTHLTLPTKA